MPTYSVQSTVYDKAKAENGVLHAERQILARLRDGRFYGLGALNGAIGTCLEAINQRPLQKLGVSRRQLFEELDRPMLQPLPAYRYELGQWSKGKANLDYHVQVDSHFYSVPYTFTQQTLDIRLSARVVELFYKGRRVALHARSGVRGGCTTDPSHRPQAHRKHLEWTPQRLIEWAGTIGPHCARLVSTLLADKPHPEQGYRSGLGLKRLSRAYPAARLEAACARALALEVATYRSVANILTAKLDQQPLPEPVPVSVPVPHDNLRGPDYYAAVRPQEGAPC